MSLSLLLDVAAAVPAAAPGVPPTVPGAGLGTDIVRTALLLSVLAVLPAMVVTMTSFIRVVIVLAIVRQGFGMPETPPNSVLVSLALFLTAFTMSPTLSRLNSETVQPLLAGRIDAAHAMERGSAPLREFMLRQTRDQDIEAIYAISNSPLPQRPEDVEILKLTPAFILNELRVAFTMGFVILLPFLLIDLVVASILLALGMMMVPPTTISLPIKLLMFVLIDGWQLVLQGVLGSFR